MRDYKDISADLYYVSKKEIKKYEQEIKKRCKEWNVKYGERHWRFDHWNDKKHIIGKWKHMNIINRWVDENCKKIEPKTYILNRNDLQRLLKLCQKVITSYKTINNELEKVTKTLPSDDNHRSPCIWDLMYNWDEIKNTYKILTDALEKIDHRKGYVVYTFNEFDWR